MLDKLILLAFLRACAFDSTNLSCFSVAVISSAVVHRARVLRQREELLEA